MNRNIYSIIIKYLDQSNLINLGFVSNDFHNYVVSYESKLKKNTTKNCIQKNQIISFIKFSFWTEITKIRSIYKYGHLSIIHIMAGYNVFDLNSRLYGACLGGHLHLINMVIIKGANDFNNGLQFACQ